jgi:hypothetical protein
MSEDPDLLKLVAINAYAAYCNSMTHRAPQYTAQYERTVHPKPGDVVLEVTTVFRLGDAFTKTERQYAGLGVLLREVMEPIVATESLAEMHAAGDFYRNLTETIDDIPKEKVFYIRPLDGSVPEFRWSNAKFIRVLSSLADIHPISCRSDSPNPSTEPVK